ncbi:MAG: hypothetical protein ACMUEM_02615 [Flavobacteriales bacterium AspAUS03]
MFTKEDYAVREAVFRKKILWTLYNIHQDSRHDLACKEVQEF